VVLQRDASARRSSDRVEREPPPLRSRLELHTVRVQRPYRFECRLPLEAAAGPGVPVEIMQHRPAPVSFLGWWRRAVECDAKSRVVRFAQGGNATGAHRVAETRDGRLARRQYPECAADAREEQEQ